MTKPKVVAIAQARMGSSRLPGKVLREAGGIDLLTHLSRRLARCKTLDEVVVATTVDPGDDTLVKAADGLGLRVHRGAIDDVLERYLGAARVAGAQVIVRITGDCPLMEPGELDRVVTEFLARRDREGLDYLSNQAGADRAIPRGLDVEVFSAAALERADREATTLGQREHVTPYLYDPDGPFKFAVTHPSDWDYGHLRLTVDTPADLALVDAVVRALGPDVDTPAIAAWLAQHPKVAALNHTVVQKGIDDETSRRRRRVDGGLLLARADAGPQIGLGHVARISALLEAWVSLGGKACLVGQGISGSLRRRLDALGVRVDEEDLSDEALLELARANKAVALCTDSYQLSRATLGSWRQALPLLSVDDLAAFEHPADLVLNQNLDFPASRYTTAAHTRLLLGHPYVLLRSEFRRGSEPGPQHPQSQPAGDRPRVLLSFGGSDPANLGLPMLKALVSRLPAEFELVLVVGPAMPGPRREALRAYASSCPSSGPQVRIEEDVADMAGLFRQCCFCLCAAGSTVWELMAMGTPLGLVAVAENQRAVLAGVEARAAGLSLGWHEDLDVDDAAGQVAQLLSDEARLAALSRSGRALVDGRGVFRVIDALLDVIEQRN